jgi:hypothetical protein
VAQGKKGGIVVSTISQRRESGLVLDFHHQRAFPFIRLALSRDKKRGGAFRMKNVRIDFKENDSNIGKRHHSSEQSTARVAHPPA